MNIDEYVFNIKKISKVPNKGREYILELYNEEIFRINDNLYNTIILLRNSNDNIKEYCENDDIALNYYNKVLEYMLQKSIIVKSHNISKNIKPRIRLNGLSLEIDLFKTKYLDKALDFLKLLVNKYVFIIILINSLIIISKIKDIQFYVVFSIGENIGILLLLIVTMFIHEIGHLAACSKYNVETGFLGIGLYTIIPRVYVNIRNIWFIENRKRAAIDLCGVYFQMIYINILFLIYYFTSIKLLIPVININLAIIMFNIIPLLNMDGYWFLLDYFDICNTRFKNIKNIIATKKNIEKVILTLVYLTITIVNVSFFLIISIYTVNYFRSIPEIVNNIMELINTESVISNLYYMLKVLMGLFFRATFIIFLIINVKKGIYRMIKKEKIYDGK